jgi:hypothetical protein
LTAVPEKKPSLSQAAHPPEKGVLFVTRSFSVADDSGIYGFPVGTRVTLVSAKGDELTVTDGIRTGKAPRTSFSAGSVIHTAQTSPSAPRAPAPAVEEPRAPQTPSATPLPIFSRMAEAKRKRYLAEKEEALKKKRARLAGEIADLTARIAAAEKEASGKKSRQTDRHYYYDSYGYAYAYSPTSAYSLSADASNIDDLRKQLAIHKEELAGLPEESPP